MFKEALRKFIEIKGISQMELSKLVGDSQQAVSDFLKKDSNPQKKTREKYFQKLDGFMEFYNETSKKQVLKNKEEQEESKISDDTINTVIETILLHEEKLMKHKVFRQWLELKLLKKENEIYREIKVLNSRKDN